MIYRLIGTCELNNVNPYEWLKDVLGKINSWPINRANELYLITGKLIAFNNLHDNYPGNSPDIYCCR